MRPTILAVLSLLCSTVTAAPLTNPLEATPDTVTEGKKLYHSTGCLACHGNNARGAVGPDLTDDVWMRKYSDEMVFKTIKNGRSGTAMSGFGNDLSDEQIWQIITWLGDENRKRKEAAK
ncbi:MAG: c-type cytochrome [Burkholderiales bacterium]|nr:c-type cytochrome [Burkholderiales bacterium]